MGIRKQEPIEKTPRSPAKVSRSETKWESATAVQSVRWADSGSHVALVKIPKAIIGLKVSG